MAAVFKTRDLVVFVPKNHSIPAKMLSQLLDRKCELPNNGSAPGTVGILTVHFFEYETHNLDTLIKSITKKEVIIVVNPEIIGYAPVNEVDYCDKLNEMVGARKFTVLSISCLHTVQTEQKDSTLRTRMLRHATGTDASAINDSLPYWFAQEKNDWYVPTSTSPHVCTKQVVMERV